MDVPIAHVVLPIGISFYTFHLISYASTSTAAQSTAQPQRGRVRLLHHALPPARRRSDRPLPRDRAQLATCRSSALSRTSPTVCPASDRPRQEGRDRGHRGAGRRRRLRRPPRAARPRRRWVGACGLHDPDLLRLLGLLRHGDRPRRGCSGSAARELRPPYSRATSITDFWRRWHISLSTWFRDYLYIPLGGNRGSRLGSTVRSLSSRCASPGSGTAPRGLRRVGPRPRRVSRWACGAQPSGPDPAERRGEPGDHVPPRRRCVRVLPLAGHADGGRCPASIGGLGGFDSLDALGELRPSGFRRTPRCADRPPARRPEPLGDRVPATRSLRASSSRSSAPRPPWRSRVQNASSTSSSERHPLARGMAAPKRDSGHLAPVANLLQC